MVGLPGKAKHGKPREGSGSLSMQSVGCTPWCSTNAPSVGKANQFCDYLRTVLDKHAPLSPRKAITHNSSPWFESIRDVLFIDKREIRQAERKWRNTKLTIFKDLYRKAKHKVSKLVHTTKCKFCTERIALVSSSRELHEIVNTLSKRHTPKILPTIYPSADLPSIFIKHITNKVEKLRADIASEHDMI